MSQALYRKYRSKSFDEVVGQDHITKTLKTALKNGQLSHAYLFTGPRGVGKTSIARILAYGVNGIDYEQGGSHLDIIEIDGASNRRIEEVRDLREKARILPASGKYKVYIIDEVHMLTREAFNALLKTLEEPPEHTIFILATTEAHKLPETIVSRTQRFAFRPIGENELAKHLASIAKSEKIQIDQAALSLIAKHGDGSFRDSISLLDQLSSSKVKISEETVREMLGLAPTELVTQILEALASGNSSQLIKLTEKAKLAGVSPAALARAIASEARLQIANGIASPKLTQLLKDLIEVGPSASPFDRLEIALIEAANHGTIEAKEAASDQKNAGAQTPATPLAKSSLAGKRAPQQTKTDAAKNLSTLDWAKIQSTVKSHNSAIGLALKHSVARLEKGCFQVIFEFPLYKNKVASVSGKALLAQSVEEVLGRPIEVECLVDKALYTELMKAPAGKEQSIDAISNIFGGGEVVESSIS